MVIIFSLFCFLIENSAVLSMVWKFYSAIYGNNKVSDEVLTVVHKNLLLFTWSHYIPDMRGIELMVKVSSNPNKQYTEEMKNTIYLILNSTY